MLLRARVLGVVDTEYSVPKSDVSTTGDATLAESRSPPMTTPALGALFNRQAPVLRLTGWKIFGGVALKLSFPRTDNVVREDWKQHCVLSVQILLRRW